MLIAMIKNQINKVLVQDMEVKDMVFVKQVF